MSKLWNGLFHHCGCKLNSSLCICECRVISSSAVCWRWTLSGLLMCCIWSVTGKGVSNWSHKISDGQLCYLWGGGWAGGLMESRMVVVKSCTSMQCFNTLLVLSFHVVGSSLGTKCFSVVHSTLISSVQGSRTSWSDCIFFWGLVQSEETYREDCPNPMSALQYVHGHRFFSQFITFNSVLCLSRPVFQ